MRIDVQALITATADAYAAAGISAADLLRALSMNSVEVEPKPVPPDLGPALEVSQRSPIRDLLLQSAPGFDWLTGDGSLAGRLAFTEIAGPDGLVRSDILRTGFFLQLPQTLYPSHSHAAAETYLILAGTSLWQKDDGPFAPVGPGSAVHHLSYQRHAMTTERDALLALWLWTGDLSFSTYRFHQ